MSKKILKILVCLAGIAGIIAGVIYFVNTKKSKEEPSTEEEKVEEDHLDAREALDLSSLNFSRHYVDLR